MAPRRKVLEVRVTNGHRVQLVKPSLLVERTESGLNAFKMKYMYYVTLLVRQSTFPKRQVASLYFGSGGLQ